MRTSAILYGQIRTLKETIYSIRRLFKEILNVDFYVVISLNKEDTKEEIENIINNTLEPKLLLFIDNEILVEELKFKKLNKNIKYKINNISFEDYKRMPYKDTYYTIEEIKRDYKDIPIIEKEITEQEIMQYPYNLYIEDYLVKKMYDKMPKEYERTYLLRTDVAWFESFGEKQKNVLRKESGFREKTVLSKDYNNTLSEKNFQDLKNKLEKVSEKENIIGGISSNKHLGVRIANLHARYFIKEDLEKYYNLMTNVEEIKNIHYKYPTLYPNWGGETLFKKVMEYYNFIFNNELYLNWYCAIIRESN